MLSTSFHVSLYLVREVGAPPERCDIQDNLGRMGSTSKDTGDLPNPRLNLEHRLAVRVVGGPAPDTFLNHAVPEKRPEITAVLRVVWHEVAFPVARLYLPRGVPLLKHVAALGGQRVCRVGAAVSIDGVTVGEALGHDRRGRPLPVWQGCTVLAADQVFLFNADRPDSLDGRYFGPLSRTTIVGRAQPIWTRSGD